MISIYWSVSVFDKGRGRGFFCLWKKSSLGVNLNNLTKT